MKSKYGILNVLLVLFLLPGNIAMTAAASSCLEGWVYDDQDGTPLEGVNVIIEDTSENEVIINTVRTSSDGYYSTCTREPGNKHVLVWTSRFSPERRTVEMGGEGRKTDFRLIRAGTVNGTILSASNQPVEGAHLSLEYLQRDDFPLVLEKGSGVIDTKKDGLFLVQNIEAHRSVRLVVTHPQYQMYTSQPLTLEGGQELTLNITLTP